MSKLPSLSHQVGYQTASSYARGRWLPNGCGTPRARGVCEGAGEGQHGLGPHRAEEALVERRHQGELHGGTHEVLLQQHFVVRVDAGRLDRA